MRPSWTETIDAMIAEDVVVSAWCDTCRGHKREIDLHAVKAVKGGDYSLWERRTRCTFKEDCNGWVKFQYIRRGGTYTRTLFDPYK